MKFVLQRSGYKTLEAQDGLTAYSMAISEIPDLIISDILMANLNGFMLYEMLNENPKTEKIPIILMTGGAQNVGAWKSQSNVGYFEKPISIKELLHTIEKQF